VQNSPTVGVGAAREWILSQFEIYAKSSDGRLTAAFDTFTAQGGSLPRPVEMRNVIGTLKGIDNPARIIILSGHYDSRASDGNDGTTDAPGADDNASAIALVLEAARILAAHQFGATILFVAFCGEEQGLFGSRNLATIAKTNQWNIEAVLNNDIVGSSGPSSQTNITDNLHVRIFSKPGNISGLENDSNQRLLARYVRDTSLLYIENLEPILVLRQDRYLRGGDQNPFADNGLSAIRTTEINENFYHQHQNVRVVNGIQYGDLEEYIDYNYLAKVTAMNVASVANIALAPSPPTSVSLANKSTLTNISQLTWKAPSQGSPVQGYNVLWRQTYEPFWSGVLFTTDTSVSLPYNKDNYLFAVQAVDSDGHESLPVLAV